MICVESAYFKFQIENENSLEITVITNGKKSPLNAPKSQTSKKGEVGLDKLQTQYQIFFVFK